MQLLSKSKLIAFRQCPKRLWLEIHRPELREESAAITAGFVAGKQVCQVARTLFDTQAEGELIDVERDGYVRALDRTTVLLGSRKPIFEAGFAAAGAIAFADVLIPVKKRGGQPAWWMIEVKSSTSVKSYHRDDANIQAFVARRAGLALDRVTIACVDKTWMYRGDDDYRGLLKEEDLTEESNDKAKDVAEWIAAAQGIVRLTREPKRSTGAHCDDPFACGFKAYCESNEPKAEYPVHWLPRIQAKRLKSAIDDGAVDMRDVPDELLNEQQRLVKKHTVSGTVHFESAQAAAALATHKLPAYFLDFETVSFAVPIWKGTRPYQAIPFQFSLHRLSRAGRKTHEWFLDLSGNDPSRAFAESLIAKCGERGPIFVYSAFEQSRLTDLGKRFRALKQPLQKLVARLVDLMPIAEDHYYHPSQQGSWSIKKLLPALSDLNYDALAGVKNGGMAMDAFLEAIQPATAVARKIQLEQELLEYCALDTEAMVRLWEFFRLQQGDHTYVLR
jgi:hypothetical protein